jgi:hypothetical protein
MHVEKQHLPTVAEYKRIRAKIEIAHNRVLDAVRYLYQI